MLTLLDFQERSISGPVMKSADHDVAISKKVRELVKKYNIKFNPEELIVDDATADAVFQGAVEFLADIGVLNISTERVIQWTKEEVEEIARWYRENPTSKNFGRGKDEHTVRPRTSTDTQPPVTWAAAAGVIQEEWFVPYLQSVAQEPVVQAMGIAGGLATVHGIAPRAGTPSEIMAGLHESRLQQEALRRTGRPGMHLGLIPTVSTTGGNAAVLAQGLRGPNNSQIGIHIIPEMKLDWERLNLSTLCQELGIAPWVSAMSFLGGLGGGPAGVAIVLLANFLAQLSISRGKMGSLYASDLTGMISSREGLWTYSAVFRAAERNIGVATGLPATESCRKYSMLEAVCRTAAVVITLTASGGAYNWSSGVGREVRIHHEVMKNVAGMPRDKVIVMLNSLSAMVEEMEKTRDPEGLTIGSAFPDMYDIQTIQPKPEFMKTLKTAVIKLAGVGVPISDKLVLD